MAGGPRRQIQPEVWSTFDAINNDVDIVVKASAGHLISVEATNINASARYLQLWNLASAPSGGASAGLVAVKVIPGNGGSAALPGANGFNYAPGGRAFSTGIVVTISTTAATFTAATTSDHIVTGAYV